MLVVSLPIAEAIQVPTSTPPMIALLRHMLISEKTSQGEVNPANHHCFSRALDIVVAIDYYCRHDSMLAPSQWTMVLQGNTFSY